MKNIIVLILLCACGCAQIAAKQAQQEAAAGRQLCEDRLKDGTYKTWGERAACANEVASGLQAKYNLPHPDLVLLANAYRTAIAARVDAGQVTPVDGELMQAQVRTYLTQEFQRRQTSQVQTQATSAASLGAVLQGFAVWQQVTQPAAPITCQHIGTLVQCR